MNPLANKPLPPIPVPPIPGSTPPVDTSPVKREKQPLPEEKPSQEEKTQEKPSTPVQSPEQRQFEQATQLVSWFEKRAALEEQLKTSQPPQKPSNMQDKSLPDKTITLPLDAKNFRQQEGTKKGVNEALSLAANTHAVFHNVLQLGAELHGEACAGAGYSLMVGNELVAGLSFMGEKWELRNRKAEREDVSQKIAKLSPDHPEIKILVQQKQQLDRQIEKLEESVRNEGLSFLATHLENSAKAVVEVLSHSTDAAATTAAMSAGAVMGTLGLIAGTAGVASDLRNHAEIDNHLVKIARTNDTHPNANVSAAIDAVKTAAIDHAAHHQKTNLKLDIFQSGFTIYNSAAVVAVTLIGAVVGVAAISALAVALPVIAGVGLLASGGIAIYKNRTTLGRGLEGMVSKRNAEQLGRLDPRRNLKIRQWRTQVELKEAVKRLDKLVQENIHTQINSESTLHLEALNIVKLSDKLEDIRYKRATQSLRDETGSLSKAAKARKEAIDFAVGDIITELRSINSTIAQLESADTRVANNAYAKLHAQGIKEAKQKVKVIDAELKKLSKPSEELNAQLKQMYQNRINEKNDELLMLGPDSTPSDRVAIETKIKELEGFRDDIDTARQAEETRLETMKDKIIKNIEITAKPTPDSIKDVVKELKQKAAELQNTGVALRDKSTQAESGTSAEALLNAIGKSKLNDDELILFTTACKASFPGVNFNDFENKQDKHQYVKTQIQKAIVTGTLFNK